MAQTEYAIRVSDVRKEFKVYTHPRQIITELLFNRHIPVFTALQDINFTVGKGEVVGIMGRNGAGKSTLLRIIAGTLDRTDGEVEVNGRLSAILELGTGFNPEYTGRENIFAGGACMGMNRQEILEKMDSIITFSELEEFIDHPFKTYSSGMQARLTFATAVAIEPEVLIVDEALAVGDARFQAKCYAKIRAFRDNGGSILLVSHSEDAIIRFCDRAILLEKGRIVMDDDPKRTTNTYLEMVYCQDDENKTDNNKYPGLVNDNFVRSKIASGASSRSEMKENAVMALGIKPLTCGSGVSQRVGSAKSAEILDIKILDSNGKETTNLQSGQAYRIAITVLFYAEISKYLFGVNIRDTHGQLVFGANTMLLPYDKLKFPEATPGKVVCGYVDLTMHLTNSSFLLSVFISDNSGTSSKIMDGLLDIVIFKVAMHTDLLHASIVNLKPSFSAGEILSLEQ